MRVEVGQQGVQPARVHVVDQHPHARAALRGGQQFAGQQSAGEVVVPHVVLHVDAARRQRGGAHAQREGVLGADHEAVGGFAGAQAEAVDRLGQRAAGRGRQRGARLAARQGRGGAGGQQQCR